MVVCAVCSQPHVTCGPVSGTAIVTDLNTAPRREPYAMADLKEYTYTVNGQVTTGMLDEHDAKALGAVLVTASSHAAPSHADVKARPDVHTAARTVPNKGR